MGYGVLHALVGHLRACVTGRVHADASVVVGSPVRKLVALYLQDALTHEAERFHTFVCHDLPGLRAEAYMCDPLPNDSPSRSGSAPAAETAPPVGDETPHGGPRPCALTPEPSPPTKAADLRTYGVQPKAWYEYVTAPPILGLPFIELLRRWAKAPSPKTEGVLRLRQGGRDFTGYALFPSDEEAWIWFAPDTKP